MNILVTGGTGYIGSHTVIELVAAGHRPVIIDNLSNSNPAVLDRLAIVTGSPIVFYEQDFHDQAALRQIIGREQIEGVIHFAAYKAVSESVSNPLQYYHNNTAGFIGLLQTLIKNNVYNIIFSSTAAVYGNPPSNIVTEENVCQPESPYGWSKYMDELILRDVCRAIPLFKGTILRYFNVVGAHQSGCIGEQSKSRPQNLLPIIMQAVNNTMPPVTIMGTDYPTLDGTCLRDYIHVVDLAKAHVAALTKSAGQKLGLFSTYNVGTGKPTSVLELIKTFEAVNNIAVPYNLGRRRAGDPVAYYASSAKIRKELAWQPKLTIDDACQDAWRWQTQNPNGYNGSQIVQNRQL